jgi:hypothetical protein
MRIQVASVFPLLLLQVSIHMAYISCKFALNNSMWRVFMILKSLFSFVTQFYHCRVNLDPSLSFPPHFHNRTFFVPCSGEIHPPCLCSQIEEFTELHIISWKEVESRKSCEETELKGLDIPLPPGLATSARSTDSERSDESSLKSSASSSLNNSTSSNANATESSSLKSSISSGVFTNVCETSNSNNSSSSGVDTITTGLSGPKSNRDSSNTNVSELLRSRNSTGSLNTNSPRTFSALALGISLHQAGDKYEQSYTPSYQVGRLPVGVVGLGNIVKNMLLKPLSADVENNDKYRTFPTNKIPGLLATDSSVHTTKKSPNTATPEVPIAQYYRVQNLAVCNDVIVDSTGAQFLPHNLLEQPSTVFVYSPDVACVMNRMSNKKLRTHGSVVSDKYVVITASIHKMYSMKEKAETSPTKTGSSNGNTPIEDFKESGKSLQQMTSCR